VVFTSLLSQNAAEKIRIHTTEQLWNCTNLLARCSSLADCDCQLQKHVEYVPTIEQKYKIKLMNEKGSLPAGPVMIIWMMCGCKKRTGSGS
jgi:hypothetical protein